MVDVEIDAASIRTVRSIEKIASANEEKLTAEWNALTSAFLRMLANTFQ